MNVLPYIMKELLFIVFFSKNSEEIVENNS